MDRTVILRATNIVAGYGVRQILNRVSLSVPTGQVVAIVGQNGAGKSTLLKCIFGLIPLWGGTVEFDGHPTERPNPYRLRQSGAVYVPQGQRVFGSLTVMENLQAARVVANGSGAGIPVDVVLDWFPSLVSRLRNCASTLSGGEKQMLAIAMGIVPGPKLLLLDEPSLGLSAGMTERLFERIREIHDHSRMTVAIVEHRIRAVLNISSAVIVLREGEVTFEGDSQQLDSKHRLRELLY